MKFKNYRLFSIIYLLCCIFIYSCSVNVPTNIASKASIIKINKDSTFLTDTIMISGTGFGIKSAQNYLFINDSIKLSSNKCYYWSENRIELENFIQIFDTLKIKIVNGSDTSNIIKIRNKRLPIIKFVEVPAGSYLRGSIGGYSDEQPQKLITFANKLQVLPTEITNRLWEIVTDNPNLEQINRNQYNLPHQNVEWNVAINFCNLLSKLSGFDKCYTINGNITSFNPTKNGFRLPTEAEWEYFTKAGTTGDTYNSNIDSIAWYNANSGYNPQFVANKLPNKWGIYDGLGNLWEWCWDWYDETYYTNSLTNDPIGPDSGTRRVIRGGSYSDGLNSCRSTNRRIVNVAPESIGLRIVRTIN